MFRMLCFVVANMLAAGCATHRPVVDLCATRMDVDAVAAICEMRQAGKQPAAHVADGQAANE